MKKLIFLQSRFKKEKIIYDWDTEKASFSSGTYTNEECVQRKQNILKYMAKHQLKSLKCSLLTNSVIYTAQNNRHQFTFSVDCLKIFLGILILTGHYSLPQEKMYWSEDENINKEIVRKCTPKNRYMEIKRNLHFADNFNIPTINGEKDRLFKIRPIVVALNASYMQFSVFSANLSIDEQIVCYFGHHFLEQFLRGKFIRFGFKQ